MDLESLKILETKIEQFVGRDPKPITQHGNRHAVTDAGGDVGRVELLLHSDDVAHVIAPPRASVCRLREKYCERRRWIGRRTNETRVPEPPGRKRVVLC